jgi:hypothetical protein
MREPDSECHLRCSGEFFKHWLDPEIKEGLAMWYVANPGPCGDFGRGDSTLFVLFCWAVDLPNTQPKEKIMFSKEKMKTIIWAWAGVSLGVLLVALGGTLGPGLSPFAPPTEMAMAATPAPDNACQVVGDAIVKSFAVPFHFYNTGTAADGKTRTTEMIYVNGAIYSQVNGKWFSFPESSGDVKGLMEANRKNLTNASCHVVRDEIVNGESATVYSAHSETPRGIHDSQVWISKSKGVLLREETDAQLPGKNGKSHVSLRFDYNNVQAPKL